MLQLISCFLCPSAPNELAANKLLYNLLRGFSINTIQQLAIFFLDNPFMFVRSKPSSRRHHVTRSIKVSKILARLQKFFNV